ncbi:histone-lysine N-methyltransferase 2D-like [Dorcoceras hygrometricum]|uniref:Histone-lysine N-methyltransferase 2D-like n=1 Tax=Dorcoceras hygrometricum TaxID=472368 RepID=A0A2Z7AVG7_9LAMI|nr:histone-lysine N-methyltransferase 2D-like [Dorcoceras hygrometricum]
MASSLVRNTNQVHFASVLAMDNSEMVAMFESLVAYGLNGFLGCMSEISETALIEFYQNASVRDDKVVSIVQGVEISEDVFARTFQLPVEGLIDIHEVPKDLNFDARNEFSLTGEQLYTSCKKRELKIEYRLLSDIMEKSITVKAGSFDAVTHERFLLMTAIFGDLELGDSEEFPPLKILTAKTVGRYIAINNKIAGDSVEGLVGKSRVKKTPGKAAPSKANLELVSVALDAAPLKTIDPTSADDVETIIEKVIAESAQFDTDVGSPVAQKTDEMEQWFNLSYEEFIASDANRRVDTASDTDGELETVVEKQPVQRSAEKEKDADFGASEDLVLGKQNEGFLSTKPTDEELMSLDDFLMQISDDMMLPSVTAAEVTNIKFGLTVEIQEVQDTDW